MKKDAEFDQMLRDNYPESPAKPDLEKMWANVQPRIARKKRRRPFLWFLFVGLIGLSAFTGWYVSTPTHSEVATTELPAESNRSFVGVESEGNTLESIPPGSETDESATARKPETDFANKIAQSQLVQDKLADKYPLKDPTNDTKRGNGMEEATPDLVSSLNQEDEIIENSFRESELKMDDLEALPMIASMLQYEERQEIDADFPVAVPEKRKAVAKAFFDVGTGYFLTNSSWKDRSGASGDDYTQRLGKEASMDGFVQSMRFGYQWNPYFETSFGLRLTRIVEKREAELTSTEDVLLENQLLYRVISDGVPKEYYGDVWVKQTTTTQSVRYNRYSDISLPISVQTRWPLSDRWSAHLGLVLDVRLKAWRTGSIYYNDNFLYDLSSDPAGLYDDGLMLRGQLGLGVQYDLNARHALCAQAAYLTPFQSLTRTDYTVDHRQSLLGLQLGLRTNIF